MSHMVEIAAKISDLESLKKACSDLDFVFLENQKTYKWFGQWVGDSPMPKGLTEADLGHCDHAISVPGAKYEVGVVKRGNDYALVWDYWQAGGLLDKLGGQKASKLMRSYSLHKTYKEAVRLGHAVYNESHDAEGGIELTLGVPSW